MSVEVLERIRELMNERGWTQYRLAQEAMLPTGTVNNMFMRKTLPSLQSLFAFCDAFGISVATFFDKENDALVLSKEEARLVGDYRTLGKKEKGAVRSLIKDLK